MGRAMQTRGGLLFGVNVEALFPLEGLQQRDLRVIQIGTNQQMKPNGSNGQTHTANV